MIGFTAILMWSLLALMTAASGTMPPFQLAAITFAIGSLPGVLLLAVKPERIKLLKQPPKVWLIGIGGLFGYHALYFTALRNAPAVEAGLIAYLWPLLIVVGSALLRERGCAGSMWPCRCGPCRNLHHHFPLGPQFRSGLSCGLWRGFPLRLHLVRYSLLTRRFEAVSTDVVTGFCLATSVLSFLCHLALKRRRLACQWQRVGGSHCLGLLPVGAAFYAWDYGVKNGDIQILGGQLCGTAALDVDPHPLRLCGAKLRIGLACLLITGGAMLAAKEMIRRKPQPKEAPAE